VWVREGHKVFLALRVFRVAREPLDRWVLVDSVDSLDLMVLKDNRVKLVQQD
jgi:hypothetical protein